MGWTTSSYWESKQDVVKNCTSSSFWGGDRFKVHKHTLKGGHLWVLVELLTGEDKGKLFVTLFLIERFDGEYGYKDIDETCGPCYYDCPIGYVNAADKSGEPLSDSAKNWRKKVREYHKEQKAERERVAQLTPGTHVELYGKGYELIEKISARLGWYVKEMASGETFRMDAKQIKEAVVV